MPSPGARGPATTVAVLNLYFQRTKIQPAAGDVPLRFLVSTASCYGTLSWGRRRNFQVTPRKNIHAAITRGTLVLPLTTVFDPLWCSYIPDAGYACPQGHAHARRLYTRRDYLRSPPSKNSKMAVPQTTLLTCSEVPGKRMEAALRFRRAVIAPEGCLKDQILHCIQYCRRLRRLAGLLRW